ncbi:RNA polymerase sigma factor [Novosphingobium sp. KACC 22771]|uniref:RNA polymerase sigma factor n=1 Tax=Novosphingobium sp. KACC 22771 TaxID=3025670 RepID=UPI002365EDF0|nr:sigma-70 family RNA polymerase sigma factor [Novosphingobium sp. KACC 22771]WDF73620.1 sigma-70 family RNA polymerase sigma factor [Novosphingobium sp. KACC 22771]
MTASERSDTLQRLYRAEQGRLLRYFRTRVGREEAPDLLQEMFTRLLRSGALERVENPSAYLSRCAQNLLIERWGKKRREQSVLFPFDDERDAPLPPEQTWRIEETDARRIYRRSLLAMPRRTRRIFLMHRLTGMTQRQIAKQVGIGEQSVAYHMMRAVTQCKNAASRSD